MVVFFNKQNSGSSVTHVRLLLVCCSEVVGDLWEGGASQVSASLLHWALQWWTSWQQPRPPSSSLPPSLTSLLQVFPCSLDNLAVTMQLWFTVPWSALVCMIHVSQSGPGQNLSQGPCHWAELPPGEGREYITPACCFPFAFTFLFQNGRWNQNP